MRKNLLILLFCVPLLWVTWREGQRLYEVSAWAGPKLSSPEGRQLPTSDELQKGKQAADAIVELPEGLVASIVRLAPAPPGSEKSVPGSEQRDRLVSEMVGHAGKREQGRQKLAEAKNNSSELEKQIKSNLRQLLGDDGMLKRMDSTLQDQLNTLGTQLKEYQNIVHDEELLDSAKAEVAWPGLDARFPRTDLEKSYVSIDRWSPKKAKGTPLEREMFDGYVKNYDAYVNLHSRATGEVVKKLIDEAKERLELANRGARLVAILTDADMQRLAQIREVVKLDDDNRLARVRTTLHNVVRALSEELLDFEQLDEYVRIVGANAAENERVKRKDVRIKLKSAADAVPLGPPGDIDEYSIEPDQVESVIVLDEAHDPPGPGISPLKGTDYSDAIRAFNSRRKQIKDWSRVELEGLRETCAANESKLKQGGGANSNGKTLFDRIEGLLEIVNRRPRLFSTEVQ